MKTLHPTILTFAREILRSEENISSSKTIQSRFGWGRVPNISSITVELGSPHPDWLTHLNMIIKENRIKKVPYVNKGMNDYLDFQISRLVKLRREKEIDKFGTLALQLMRKSVSFRVAAIHKVVPHGYKAHPWHTVLKGNHEVSRILRDLDGNPKIKRVYIPKGDSKRPLGVPTVPGRIAAHMLNNMLNILVPEDEMYGMHGFIPGKGTLTAGTELMSMMFDYEGIYEFDLKQCFPSINVNYVDRIIKDSGSPKYICDWLANINRAKVDLPEECMLPQDEMIKFINDEAIGLLKDFVNGASLEDTHNRHLAIGNFVALKNYPHIFYHSHIPEDPQRKIILPGVLHFLEKIAPKGRGPQVPGLPQGLSTSPLFTILALKPFLRQQPSISYADDGLFFGRSEFQIKDQPSYGIVLHPEKSGGVKKAGVGQKPLKFLGLTYHHDTDSLHASTKKGSQLVMSNIRRDRILNMLTIENLLPDDRKALIKEGVLDTKYHSGRELFESRLGGMMQSRLYSGSWDMEHLEQNFVLKGGLKSGLTVRGSKDRKIYDIFNCSSYACRSLSWKIKSLGLSKRRSRLKLVRKIFPCL